MLVTEIDRQRLGLIDRLLREQEYDSLERFVIDEVAHGLLDDATLVAARVLGLSPVVILLATLGIENLASPGDRGMWLAVYQSIGRKAETEDFQHLRGALPVVWVTHRLMNEDDAQAGSLDGVKGKPHQWLAAVELALDHRRFDLVESLVTCQSGRKVSVEDWLRMARVLVERQPFVANSIDVIPLARTYTLIRDQLPQTAPLAATRSVLARSAASCFLAGGDSAQAIVMANQAPEMSDEPARLVTLAEAHCRSGDLPAAIDHLDQLLAVSSRHLEAYRKDREEEELKQQLRPTFDPAMAAQALVDLQKVLDRSNQKAFLVSGTLLGYAREGALLAHDKDIDVGILHWEDQFDIVLALMESGLFWVETRTIGGERTFHIPISHLPTGTSIDVFIYHAEGEKLVTGVQSYFGYLQKFAFTPFELEKVDFLGVQVFVPDDVDTNLRENFGDWRASDPDYISHLESPSTVDVGGPTYQLVGRLNMIAAMRNGKVAKLRRAIALMREHAQLPHGMSETLLTTMDEMCSTLAKEAVNEPA